jgi:hypothetical protein
MTFQTIPLDALPKRESKKFDADKANALLAAVQTGEVATDGTSYADEAEARKLAAANKRLLQRVIPAGKVARTRVFVHPDGGFAWGVFLADPSEKQAKGKGK